MAKKAKVVEPVVEEVVIASSGDIRTPGMRDIEVVYRILKQENRLLYFRELLSRSLEGREGVHAHSWAHVMSEIYTQMNMDSRFYHEGKNRWGLAEWVAQNDVKVLRQFENSQISMEKRRREMAFETIQETGVDEEAVSQVFEDKSDESDDE